IVMAPSIPPGSDHGSCHTSYSEMATSVACRRRCRELARRRCRCRLRGPSHLQDHEHRTHGQRERHNPRCVEASLEEPSTKELDVNGLKGDLAGSPVQPERAKPDEG